MDLYIVGALYLATFPKNKIRNTGLITLTFKQKKKNNDSRLYNKMVKKKKSILFGFLHTCATVGIIGLSYLVCVNFFQFSRI